MAEKYVVRFAIFRRKNGGDVFYPSGKETGSKRRGFPSQPPPPYRAPKEETRAVSSYAQARQLVRELRLEHGEQLAVTVERVETAKPAPKPRQGSLAELGDDWPHLRPARWRLTQ